MRKVGSVSGRGEGDVMRGAQCAAWMEVGVAVAGVSPRWWTSSWCALVVNESGITEISTLILAVGLAVTVTALSAALSSTTV